MKLASVTGRQLDLGLLHALEPEVDLEPWLAAVAEVSVIEAHGESWRFAHDKLREEIKDSLTHEEHHALHRRVAEGLEVVYPDAADQAAALAYHWAVAGDREKERHYAVLAGRQAVRKDVSEEAIAFFQRALQLLSNEAESPERDRRELAVLMDLGPQLTVARGFGAPEVEANYARAQELALRVGMANDLFRTIWGQWSHHNQVLGFGKARGFLEQLFRLAEQSGDESLILAALHAGWASEFTRGDHILVANYIERGLRIYDFDRNNDHTQLYSHDPGMCAHMHGSINLWLMGYPDRAFHMAVAGQAMAGKMKAGDQRYSDISVAFVAYLRGEYQDALELGRAVKMRAEEAGHQLTEAYALLAMGVAHTGLGQHAQGLATAREALQAAVGMYADSWRTFFLAGFLEACLAAGNVEEGLQTIHIELAEHELSGQRVFESEARRLYGELILASGSDKTEKAEREFQLAFDIAHQQSARSLQLRAMMSLARLWQKQGNIPRARERLAELYRWFSEGIDTDDLVTARQLLDDLQ